VNEQIPRPRSPYTGHPWDDPASRAEGRLFRLWADAVKALQRPGAGIDERKAEQAAWSGIRDYIAELWDSYDTAIERAEAAERRTEELELWNRQSQQDRINSAKMEAEFVGRLEAANHRIAELAEADNRTSDDTIAPLTSLRPWRCDACGAVIAFPPDKQRGFINPECHAVYLDTAQQPRRCNGELEPFAWTEP
jgi:rubrerythrin